MNKVVEILLKAKDYASKVVQQFTQRVRNMGDVSDKSTPRVINLGASADGISGRFRRAAASIAAFVAAAFTLQKAKQLISSVLDTGSQFETFRVQLEGVFNNVEEGEAAFEWIKRFTKNTPLQLNETTEAFIKLKNFGLDPMDGSLQAIVDQNAKLGGGQERLNGIILAVGQSWAKQKLQAEEVLQLVERGVPVYSLLEKALGKTTSELQEMQQQGKLGRDAIAALVKEMGAASFGQAQKEMRTWSGLVSNARDVIDQFLNRIADAGVLDYFKAQLSSLLDVTAKMAADGRLQAYAARLSGALIGLAQSVQVVIQQLFIFGQKIAEAIGELRQTTAIEEFRNAISSAFTAIGEIVLTVTTPFRNFFRLFTDGVAEVDRFGITTGQVFIRLTQLATAFSSAIATGFYTLRTVFSTIAGVGAATISVLLTGISGLSQALSRVTFGDLSDSFKVASEQAAIAAESFAQSSKVNFNQARLALEDVEKSAVKTRSSFGALINPIEKVGASSAKLNATAAAADKLSAGAVNAGKGLDKLAEKSQNVSEEISNVSDTASEFIDSMRLADETLSGFGQQINTADTIDKLDELGVAAGLAWEKGKLSAEEYLQIMGQIDAQKEKLIETTNRLAEAERAAAEAAADKAKSSEEADKKVVMARMAATEASKLEAEAMAKARDEINQTSLAHGYGIQGLVKYWNAVQDLKQQYIDSNKNANNLADGVARLDGNTRVSVKSLEQYSKQLASAIKNGDQLNSQTLGRLQSALSAVRTRLQDINSETKSAANELSGLQGELAGLEGDQKRVQELNYIQRRADLQAKLTEAEADGNEQAVQSYQRALKTLEKINAIKKKNIAVAEREAKLEKSSNAPAAVTNNTRQQQDNSPAARSTETLTVAFRAPDGASVNGQFEKNDAQKLIQVLNQSGATTQ